MDEARLKELVEKHSQFASSFPIYLISSSSSDNNDDEADSEISTTSSVQRLNEKGPIWMRETKEVTEEEYKDFYQVLVKDQTGTPLGWSHWRGDSGSGVSFRALMYIPGKLPQDFWQDAMAGAKAIRLMVKVGGAMILMANEQ